VNLRQQFPILRRTINGKPLVYLDNAASSQKPLAVTDAMKEFDEKSYANVHRSIHTLGEEATEKYEEARAKIAQFIRASSEEVIFTSGTTESLNNVARMLVQQCKPGDEIVVTIMEHHSNFVPWQQLAKQHNLVLKIIPITPDFSLDMEAAKNLITAKTKIVSVVHVSNVLGTITPVNELAVLAHKHGALLVVDGAQAPAHMRVDVKALDADFYAFSGHKMYGPTGIGVLYGKREHLTKYEPPSWGGEMVNDVTIEATTWNDLPWKFEPGTPKITQAIGLGFAVDFLKSVGYEVIEKHERVLLIYTLEQLAKIDGLVILGSRSSENRGETVSFTVENIHPHDLAQSLDDEGVAVRAGHHCTQPLHCALGIDASTRVSIGLYNTKEEIDRLLAALQKAIKVLS